MIKQLYENIGLEFARQEGNEYLFVCPWCGKKKLSVNETTGLFKCWSGCLSGNTYTLLRKYKDMSPQDALKLMEEYGLDVDRTAEKKAAPKKVIRIKPSEREPLSKEDCDTFCNAKGLDPEAFMLLKPERRIGKPEVLIPAFNPMAVQNAQGIDTPIGWIRAGLNGQPCKIKYKDGEGNWCEKDEKYPLIAGSSAGIIGVHNAAVSRSDVIVFAEGWKDACKALEFGYTAVAGSNGAGTFREEWMILFRNKNVVIVFDRDHAGTAGAIKAGDVISGVAKSVQLVTLPYTLTKDGGKDLYDYLKGVRE